MIDLSKISYRVVVSCSDGKKYKIKNYITGLGWEENENELAARISFTCKNDKTSKGKLSKLIKPECIVKIFASDGNTSKEVARGKVTSWNPNRQNSGETLKCTAYDVLYDLQKSQDNRFYPKGTGTKAIISKLLSDWKVKLGTYTGPNVSHGKLAFKSAYISDIILDVLDDAKKRGAGKYILRASKGKAQVVKRGSNNDVYVFKPGNSISMSQSVSTENLVTKVKVYGKADDKGKSSVEAVVTGLTKYGVRQRIYTRGSDESLSDAKKAAQDIIDEDGIISKDITIQSPDVPFIRKGDLIYCTIGANNYYYVKSIRHDCENGTMTMEVEKKKTKTVISENKTGDKKKEYSVGDIVNFKGDTHYVSSYSDSKGYPAKAGKAKITKINSSGAHPWHLIHTNSGSNVYGWVNNGTFS